MRSTPAPEAAIGRDGTALRYFDGRVDGEYDRAVGLVREPS